MLTKILVMMEKKETHATNQHTLPHLQQDEVSASGELESIIKGSGYDNGRLFASKNKATYTFLYETEVVSLHFDAVKQVLFLKGHKITNLENHPRLSEFLARFKKVLLQHRAAKKLLIPFDIALLRLNTI